MMSNQTFEEKYRGKTFGKLTILRKDPEDTTKHVLYVEAECNACGNRKIMLISNIIYGLSKTCGCGQRLAVSKSRRRASKIFIDTPQGPKTIRDIAETHNVPYQRVYARWKAGRLTVEDLIGSLKRKMPERIPDPRLNGMTNKEVAKQYGMSKQLVSNRIRRGWVINAEGDWVSPSKGSVGTTVYRMSEKARKNSLRKRYMEKLYE